MEQSLIMILLCFVLIFFLQPSSSNCMSNEAQYYERFVSGCGKKQKKKTWSFIWKMLSESFCTTGRGTYICPLDTMSLQERTSGCCFGETYICSRGRTGWGRAPSSYRPLNVHVGTHTFTHRLCLSVVLKIQLKLSRVYVTPSLLVNALEMLSRN